MENIFLAETTNELINRINSLDADTQPQWGKMTAPQMLAHCCVSYEMAFENKHPKPNPVVRLMLRLFVKPTVCGNKPYARNSRTAPAFIIKDPRNFEEEKGRLIQYIIKTQKLGPSYFDGKESLSFGKLSQEEWNTLFFKHLNHHLTQFGA